MPEQAIAAIAMQKPPTTSKALSTTVGSPLADSEGALGEAGSDGAREEGITPPDRPIRRFTLKFTASVDTQDTGPTYIRVRLQLSRGPLDPLITRRSLC